jgi:hypothetical protein
MPRARREDATNPISALPAFRTVGVPSHLTSFLTGLILTGFCGRSMGPRENVHMLLRAILSQQSVERALPEPQREDSGKADSVSRRFLRLGGCATGFGSPRVSVVDDGEKLAIATKGIPMWFVVVCLTLPLAAVVALFLYVWIADGVCDWRFIPFFVLGPIVALEIGNLASWLNRKAGDGVVRAVLDRAAQTLELRDYGVTLPARMIKELILVRGWQTKRTEGETDSTWAIELSVVGETATSEVWRWHVITGRGRRLEEFADEVAREFRICLSKCRA